MLKRSLFFMIMMISLFVYGEVGARIARIEDTAYGASFSRLASTSPSSGEMSTGDETTAGDTDTGTSNNEITQQLDDSSDDPVNDPLEAATASEECLNDYQWPDCENSTSCAYYQYGGASWNNSKNCACVATDADMDICDGTYWSNHSLFNFANYARAKGFGYDFDNMTPISGYTAGNDNYYYHNNPHGFCPYVLHVSLDSNLERHEYNYYALTTAYYSNTVSPAVMKCHKSTLNVDIIGDVDNGLECIKPGYNDVTRETSSSICVYNATNFSSPSEYVDYFANETERCPTKAAQHYGNGSNRNLYALSGYDDDLATRYADDSTYKIYNEYYLYRPNYEPADFAITECSFNCSANTASYNDDIDAQNLIAPQCQGWKYIYKCDVLRQGYESDDTYHIADLQTSHAVAAVNAVSGVDHCIDNGADKYFAVCYPKSSHKSEAQCQADNATCVGAPTEADCGGNKYCSACICPSQYKTLSDWCSANGVSAASCTADRYEGDVDSGVCMAEGDAKYANWILKSDAANACISENRSHAIESLSLSSAQLTAKYGTGAEISQCWDTATSEVKWQVSCASDVFSTICHVNNNSTALYCVMGRNDNVTMRSEAGGSYPMQYCQTPTGAGECGRGVNRLDANGNTSYDLASSTLKIYTVSSPEACYSTYGKAAVAQVCISGTTSAYNCYYDLSEFAYATTNQNGAIACAVRHDLSGDYIIYNGQKRWSQCACSSTYKYNQYAGCSAGILGGNPCVQDLSNVNNSTYLKAKWTEILGGATSAALDSNGNINISSVTLYPYCVCDPSYKYTCSGERETGVGGDCLGKYQSCTCAADPTPDHWVDDYFSCPEGYGPTGVWKDNGCGHKIWECSNAISCTSEYKYTCDGAGQKGVDGQGCQDSTGAYVRFKACECQSGYTHLCTGSGQTGDGEACIIGDDEPKYKSCSCPDGYSQCGSDNTIAASGATACTVEPEEGSSYTTYSECQCPEDWTDCNADGQEGDDTNPNEVCQWAGQTVYKYCRCPSGLQDCSNPDDTTLYPPIAGVGSRAYVGVEASGYKQCKVPNVAYEAYRYQACKCNDEIFTVCDGNGASGIGAMCQTVNDQKPMYASCVCNNSYTSTCPVEEGKGVAIDRAYDYCQIGEGEKLYKPEDCVCNASGWSVCSGNAQVGVGAPCLVGEESATNQPKYASCACDNQHRVTCDGPGQFGLASDACVNSSGETFYSSCSCNTGWVTCTGTQSGVGTACLENNVEKYEACQCKEDYKYTCLGNAYDVPTDSSDVCILNGVSYYTSCNCASGYTETCEANGEKPLAPNDYCERDGIKYYQACGCGSEYNKTCDFEDNLEPANPDDYCVEHNDNDTYNDTYKYKQCKCRSGYNATCTKAGEIPPTETSGVIDNFQYNDGICNLNGVNYYTTCKCASGMSRCLGNYGDGDENSGVCVSHGKTDSSGNWLDNYGTKYYQNCICDPNQYQVCNELAGDGAIAGTTVGSNICEMFISTLSRNSQGIWQVSSSETKTASSDCACRNYYASDSVISAVSGRNHQLKSLTTGYAFDTNSTKCVGYSSAFSGAEKFYTAYQAETDDPDWYRCYPPSRAVCTAADGSDCNLNVAGYELSKNGCECPPWYSTNCSSYVINDTASSGNVKHPSPGWARGHAYTSSEVSSWASQCTKLSEAANHDTPTATFSVWRSNAGIYLANPQKYILSGLSAFSGETCPNVTIRDSYLASQNYFTLNPNQHRYSESGVICYRQEGCLNFAATSYLTSYSTPYACAVNSGQWINDSQTCTNFYAERCENDADNLRGAYGVCIWDQQNNIDFVQINYVIYTDNSNHQSTGGWDGNYGRVCANANVVHGFTYRGPSGSGVSIDKYFTSYSLTNQSSYTDVEGNTQTCGLSGGRRQIKEHYCGTYLNVENGLSMHVYNTGNSNHYYPSCTVKGSGSSTGSEQVLPQCIFIVDQMSSSTDGYSSDNSNNNCIADQWVKAHWNHLTYANGGNVGQNVPIWADRIIALSVITMP